MRDCCPSRSQPLKSAHTGWRQDCQHCDVVDGDDDYDVGEGGDKGGGGDDKAWERNAVEEEEG